MEIQCPTSRSSLPGGQNMKSTTQLCMWISGMAHKSTKRWYSEMYSYQDKTKILDRSILSTKLRRSLPP